LIRRLLPALLLALLASTAPADEPPSPSSWVLRSVRLERGDGTSIPDAVVVVRDGRIEAAGPASEVKAPAGLPAVDGGGGTVMPAMVLASSRLGLPSAQGASDRATPTETVEEEFPPAPGPVRIAAREGFLLAGLLPGPGAPGGEGLPVRLSAEGGAARAESGGRLLRVDVDPSTGWARSLSGAFDAAKKEIDAEDKYEKDMSAWRIATAEFERKKAAAPKGEAPKPDAAKAPPEPKAPKPEERTRIVRDAVRRKAVVSVNAGTAADLDRVLDVLAPWRPRLAVRASGDAWRAAARAAGAGATVVLEPGIQNEPGSLNRVNPSAVFAAAGCPLAFVPRDEGRRSLSTLRAEVGILVRAGLPREAAIRGLASEGARVLGLEGEAGLVAAGRSADLLLFDGDPLEPTARLVAAWAAGKRIPAPGGREKP
jgi:imidazolonepropionase-like amidohydrolase